MTRVLLISRDSDCKMALSNCADTVDYTEHVSDAMELLQKKGGYSVIMIDHPSEQVGIARLLDYIQETNNYVFATAVLLLTDNTKIEQDSRFLGGVVVDCITRPFHEKIVRNRIIIAEKMVNDISFNEFAEMLKVLPANIYLKDATGKYVFSSQTWHHLDTGNDPNWTIRGKTDLDIRKDKDNALLAMKSDKRLIESGKGTSYIIREDANGTEYLQLIKEPLFDENGKVKGIIALINNVTEQELMRQKLKERSIHDTLTGVYNRMYLDEYLMEIRREKQYPISVISADCDNLKLVNDTYGHMTGDRYICKSVELMQSIFPKRACIFRTGGDEFVVFLPDTASEETEHLLEEIQKRETDFLPLQEKAIPVSLSVGYAVVYDESDSIVDAMRLSDSEMYKNKRKKKSRCGI